MAQAHGLTCYVGRVGFVLLLGLLPFFTLSFPYWNWYGFPTNFTLAQLADKLITYLVAGLVLAALVEPSQPDQSNGGIAGIFSRRAAGLIGG